MKKLLLSITLLICFTSQAQRILEIVTPPTTNNVTEVAMGNVAYFADRLGNKLQSYDGTTYREFIYPRRDGTQLIFVDYLRNIIVFESKLYIVLAKETTYESFLYRFDGDHFEPVSFPGNLASNIVLYRYKITALIGTSGGVKLFSCDDSGSREIFSEVVPSAGGYQLTGGANLYIRGIASPTFIIRFNGSSFMTLPTVAPDAYLMTDCFQIVGSEKVFFIFDDRKIEYFDGVTMTEIFFVDGLYVFAPTMFRGTLYFMTRTEEELAGGGMEYRLLKSSDGTLSDVVFPSAQFSGANQMAVYRGQLYLPAFRDGHFSIYRYDGTAFTEFFPLPGGASSTSIKVRRGNLVILPKLGTSSISYEYNGIGFIEIMSPAGEDMFQSEASTACFHVWLVGFPDWNDFMYNHAFAIERVKDCTPPTGDDDREPVLPKLLTDYEHILITDIGKERDWCWTGIDVDWEIDPICPVLPCHDPAFGTTLRDKNGKIAWQKTFDKPFSTSIPLADTQPYALSLSVENNKALNDVLIFDKDLVNKGIENITLDMYPKQEYFYLTVSTDKNVKVPFTMTLKNTQGQSLWQEKYTAPMDQLVYAFVPKAGDYLQFSLQNTSASNVTYFPNPFNGKLNVSIPAANQNVRITISDFNGKVVADQKFSAAGDYVIDVSDQKSGLFVLTIIEGSAVRKELVQLTK